MTDKEMYRNEQMHEYILLKDEINKLRNSQTVLTTFAITTVIAVLGFVPSDSVSSIVYLSPLFLLLPISLKLLNYKISIYTIAAYMITIIEENSGFNWETITYKSVKSINDDLGFLYKLLRPMGYLSLPIMGAIDIAFYWMRYINFTRGSDFFAMIGKEIQTISLPIGIIVFIVPVLIELVIIITTIVSINSYKFKNNAMKKFQEYKTYNSNARQKTNNKSKLLLCNNIRRCKKWRERHIFRKNQYIKLN